MRCNYIQEFRLNSQFEFEGEYHIHYAGCCEGLSKMIVCGVDSAWTLHLMYVFEINLRIVSLCWQFVKVESDDESGLLEKIKED